MNLIVAICKKNGIGKDGNIPWYIKEDLKYFKDITSFASHQPGKNVVIMGRKTWESIPEKYKPLSNRINIILSKTMNESHVENYNDTYIFSSLDSAINNTIRNANKTIYVIGGESIYQEAINRNDCDHLYITEIYKDYDCDTFFPKIDSNKYLLKNVRSFRYNKTEDVYFRNLIYISNRLNNRLKEIVYVNSEERQYLNLLDKILHNGVKNIDRTGVGTLSVFGEQLKYNLRETFPLLTTKRMFVRGIFEELLLYISGKTDNKIMQEKNIHIWDGNTSREFLDNRGLSEYEEGDMGETYGFNFRHYGAEYKGCRHDYSGQGFDQLKNVIDLIKNTPSSRRMIINLFNPATQHKAALPACLCQYQFYVNSEEKTLNLQIYIRSSDFFLANNWNACTGGFLVHLICNLNGIDLTPGDLTVVTGDTHIYLNHIEGVKENLKRIPKPPPMLKIRNQYDNIEDFTYDDIEVIGYSPYPSIKVDMAI